MAETLPRIVRAPLSNRLKTLRAEVEVLVVTATPVEKAPVLARMAPLSTKSRLLKGAIGPATYYVGRLGEHAAALTMCRMGVVGGGSSKDAVADGCRVWAPRAAVMVGIAFGKDPDKQRIADVLVASHIVSYAERR